MMSGYERRDSGSEPAGTAVSAAKIRVYELAKEFGMAPKDLVAKVRTLGVEVANHMSNLDGVDADRVRRAIERERQESLVEERLSDTVIRRRSRTASPGAARPAPARPAARPVAAPVVETPFPAPPPETPPVAPPVSAPAGTTPPAPAPPHRPISSGSSTRWPFPRSLSMASSGARSIRRRFCAPSRSSVLTAPLTSPGCARWSPRPPMPG